MSLPGLFAFLFVTLFAPKIYAVTEHDVTVYLMSISLLKTIHENKKPPYYMDNALPGWNSSDPRVKELVGLVCENFDGDVNSFRYTEVKQGCLEFESMAAWFLLRFYKSLSNKSPKKSMASFQMSYYSVRVYYESVKDMMLSVCLKSPEEHMQLRKITPELVPILVDECDDLINDTIEYLTRAQCDMLHNYNGVAYPSKARPGGTTSMGLVKPIIPWVCERHFNTPTWESIQQPCELFNHDTRGILLLVSSKVPLGSTVNINQILAGKEFEIRTKKHFIASTCEALPQQHAWIAACRYLLKEHMELLMRKKPEIVTGSRLEEEQVDSMDEDDLMDMDLATHL